MKKSVPVNLERKIRTDLRGRKPAQMIVSKELQMAVFVAQPNFFRSPGEVELHLAHHFIHAVGIRHDLDTDFWCDRQAVSSAIRGVTFTGNPDDIRHLGAVSGLDGAFHNDATAFHVLFQQLAEVVLKSTVPGVCGAHNDLVKAVGFDLVRQIAQIAILTNVSPGNHADKFNARDANIKH